MIRSLRLVAITGFASLLLGAAACSGDDDAAIDPSSSSGSAADAAVSSSSSSGSTSGSSGTRDAAPEEKDIVDTAVGAGSFTILADLLARADLVTTLKGEGPFTVLAPTDAAFAKLPAAVVTALQDPANKALLQRVLTYHVFGARIPAADVVALDGKTVSPLEGENLSIKVTGGAPTLVDGSGALLATVTSADVMATNGIIHVIDTVLVPPTAAVALDPEGKDIVDTAVAAGFSTLADLLTDADLVATLQGPGPFTVFAPTNQAFTDANAALAGLTPAQVKNALLFHVSSGITGSAKVLASSSIPSLFSAAPITVNASQVQLNGQADIDTTMIDIACKNGIIHVLKDVMVPAGL